MNRGKFALTLLAAISVAVPAATATWYTDGTFEPDTTFDTGGYMWPTPDTDPAGRKVYFNAWADLDYSGVNPNSGATGSRIYVTPSVIFNAYLGIWKDCNEDGYIGMADGNLAEYPTALLSNTVICPAGSEFIKGSYVYEFIWVGPTDDIGDDEAQASYGHPAIINDTEARVWHDWGFPGQKPGRTCPITPLPAGTTGSTGGLIYYADCFASNRVSQTINLADPNGDLGLNVGDRPQASDSLLNQQLPHLWEDPYNPGSTGIYEADSGDAAFTAFDCSQKSDVASPVGQVIVSDPTEGEMPSQVVDDNGTIVSVGDEDGNVFSYGAPAPAAHNPQGSYYDGINNTWNFDCPEDGSGSFVWTSVEGAHGGVDANVGRMEHDTSFEFFNSYAQPNACVLDDSGDEDDIPQGCDDIPVPGVLVPGAPNDLGVSAGRSATTVSWQGVGGWVTTPQSISRATLGPQGPIFSTYYAYVGGAALSIAAVPANTLGTYGSDWCNGSTSTIEGGFDCDADHWWNPKYDPGTSLPSTQTGGTISTQCTTGRAPEDYLDNCRELSVKPGHAYNLRDVDCYDGTVARGVPVYASLVALSDNPEGCANP